MSPPGPWLGGAMNGRRWMHGAQTGSCRPIPELLEQPEAPAQDADGYGCPVCGEEFEAGNALQYHYNA